MKFMLNILFFMIFIYMMLIGILLMNISLIYSFLKEVIFIDFKIFLMKELNMNFLLMLDWVSLSFMGVVLFISSFVIFYSIEYMYMDINKFRYFYLLLMFVISMILMILSPSLFSILIGWDGLGVVSYCLVIYYYNFSSLNAGMITILLNRLGDLGLLMSISLIMIYGSWHIYFLYDLNLMLLMLIFMGSFTKSAQMPFSSWLPAAMAAPTPISALVHSSTLVTAGVYLLIRFNMFLSVISSMLLIFITSMTMFMSGLMANFEIDLKKIIALSTLSQLSIMMSILYLGWWQMSYFHLLIHALFKSMLFMCSGIMIHLMSDSQDIRMMGGVIFLCPFLIKNFFLANLCLCGFPFLSGFFSKDLIMELFLLNLMNPFMMLILFLSLMLTVSYTVRLILYIFIKNVNCLKFLSLHENSLMSNSMFGLSFFSIVSGMMMNWLLFNLKVLVILTLFLKVFVLLICLIGVIMGLIFYKFNYNNLFFSSMWYLSIFFKKIYLDFFNLGFFLILLNEKGLIEFYMGKFNYYYMSNMWFKLNLIFYELVLILIIVFIMYMNM